MKISAPLGFLLAAFVVYFGISSGVKNASVFLNTHAIIIVCGGTLAATLVCFPLDHFVSSIRLFFRTLFGKAEQQTFETINEIIGIAQKQNQGQPLSTLVASVKNPFLKESLSLVAEQGLNDVELLEVLEKRIDLQNERYRREGSTYKIIGKFPPAFGLVGTSLGMITLLQGLGEANAFERLGPAMSIALVATFYGLVLANMVIIPMGENLTQASEQDLITRRMIIDGVLLIKEKKHPLLVTEYLHSYLTPGERNKVKKAA